MKIAEDLTDLIGNTPLVKLQRLFPEGNVYGKCEFMNPMSIKDRPIFQIFLDAEAEGKLKPGDTVIEITSGNTGIAVAYISAIRGYKAILVMSEIQSLERRQILRALGAELILTPAELGTKGARQHTNQSNPKAHYLTTGPEIWASSKGEIDILIAGLGTGGTISGAGKYLKEKKSSVKLIAVEPFESPYISQGIFRPHKLMGTAPGFVPETLNKEIIDEIVLVKVKDAFAMCREIGKKEGMLVGISSGATCKAAEDILKVAENREKFIVVILADSGERYLSVEGLFD